MTTSSYWRKEHPIFCKNKLFLSDRKRFLDLKKMLDRELYKCDYIIIHINFKLLKRIFKYFIELPYHIRIIVDCDDLIQINFYKKIEGINA